MQEVNERSSIKSAFQQQSFVDLYDDSKSSCFQRIPKRHIIAFLAFLGFCNIYALRVNLSVGIVAMTSNSTGSNIHGRFDWSPELQGYILSSFFYGYIVTQLPAGWFASVFGGKKLFGFGVLGTAVLTLLTPWCSRTSPYLLIALRVVEGLFEGVTYPSMHAVWARWAPPLERSKLATFAFSGSYVGTVFSLPLSAVIAQKIGWPAIFYIFGALGVAWYFLWMVMATETPARYKSITQDELDLITQTIGFTDHQSSYSVIGILRRSRNENMKPPWRKIVLSLPVWAIIVAHFTENWGFYTLLTELPRFLDDTTDYDLKQAGFLSALPYLVMAVVVQVGGQLADFCRRRGYLSTTATRRIFTCVAFLCQTVFMLITSYTMLASTAIACLTIAVGLGGFAWAGFSVNHLDIAPQYASILMGLSNTFATLPGIISPILTGYIVKDHLASQWRVIFFISGSIYCFGAVIYGLLASGEKQRWAEPPVVTYKVPSDEETETEVED